jgi:hypothetical protein
MWPVQLVRQRCYATALENLIVGLAGGAMHVVMLTRSCATVR